MLLDLDKKKTNKTDFGSQSNRFAKFNGSGESTGLEKKKIKKINAYEKNKIRKQMDE